MRRSLALIPAMALALAAQSAHAQQQEGMQSDALRDDRAAEGVPLEQPGAIDRPRSQARQELEIQDIQMPRDQGTQSGRMERGMVGKPEMDPPRNALSDDDPIPLPDVPEAVAEEIEEDGLDVRVPDSVGQPPRQSGQAMERTRPARTSDPVPLPDVPEAIAREMEDVGGIDIPEGVGEPPDMPGRRSGQDETGQGGAMQDGGAQGDVTVTTTRTGRSPAPAITGTPSVGTADDGGGREAQGLQAPPEPVDADREYYPGQPEAARAEGTPPDAAFGVNTIVGKEVISSAGDLVGDVEDVLIDLEQGGAAFAVIGLEDGRQVLVPWKQLSATGLNDRVIVSLPPGTIASLPEYE